MLLDGMSSKDDLTPDEISCWNSTGSEHLGSPPRPRVVAAFPRREAPFGSDNGTYVNHRAPPPPAFLGLEPRPVLAALLTASDSFHLLCTMFVLALRDVGSG